MRIGFAVFLVEGGAVAAYLALTPHGPHRAALWLMVALWLAVGAANLACTPMVATRQWRTTFSVAWTTLSAFAAGGVAAFDGGIRSPLVLLLFLPISYAAWAFSPVAAAACGASCTGAALVLAASVPGSSAPRALVVFAVLGGATILSVSAARNRATRERREAELLERIAELASTDGLTGCSVHRVFHQRLREEVARSQRHGHPLSLMLIDVDHFKAVNDTYGHVVGDNVLAAVGSTLRRHCRSSDVVGRLGGDEFGVIMPDTEPDTARALADRFRAALRSTAEVDVTTSVGIAGLDPSSPAAEHLVDEADFALYQVKGRGRDGVAVRTPAAH